MKRYATMVTTFVFGLLALCGGDASASTEPPTVESGYIDVDGGRLYYEKAGGGDAIVLIHDGMIHHEIWDGQFLEFAKDHTVVRYDRRGYGRSDPPTAPFSNVDDLFALFETLNIDRAAVMGMSAGGGVTIDFTLAHPDKVSALVLVGAVVSGFDYTMHFRTRGGRLTAQMYADPDTLRHFFAVEDPYEVAPENTEAKLAVKRLIDAYPDNLNFDHFRMIKEPERPGVDHLNEITAPALIVVGEADIPDVHAHAGAIDAGIPVARRVVVSGAGHLVPIERPQEFNELVLAFINEAPFLVALETGGVAEAVRAFHDGRRNNPQWIPFGENEINERAYTYLLRGEVADAIELFKLYVAAYPDSWNAYDSLAEGYMTAGEKERAIEFYRKSLEMNPENTNATTKLQELGAD